MPLDVLGRTRATLTEPASFFPWPEGHGALQLLLFNEEFLVSVSHQLALITSLPFVHTVRSGRCSILSWLKTAGGCWLRSRG
ncbi:hypothetical protein EI94DRAFT_1780356 [Lactarius quietus]|nr:hypothetical protein EI94DRAFT_1780356 [Lactarius quietus]